MMFNKCTHITVKHQYFSEGLPAGLLSFTADSATQVAMKRFGFFIQTNPDGFSFYTTSENDLADYLNYVEKVSGLTAFVFNMQVNEEAFYTYTALPTGWLGTIDYSSNSVNADGLIPSYSKEVSNKGIGRIALQFTDLVKGVYEAQIQFASRATNWTYYIINHGEVNLNNPEIDGKTIAEFESKGEVALPNNQKGIEFRSIEQIPLETKPNITFDLVDKRQSETGNERFNKKIIFRGLPIATAHQTTINKELDDEFTSYMYVYL